MIRFLLAVAALTALYLAVLGSTAGWDVAAGILVSVALLAAHHLSPFRWSSGASAAGWSRLAAFPAFLGAVLAEVVRGTVTVVRLVISPRRLPPAGIVAIPLGERTDVGIVASAFTATVAPATVFVDVDRRRRQMYLHVVDASDPQALRERQRWLYERRQAKVFP